MRLIDADKIDFNEVFKGQSDFARDTREAAQSLIDSKPDMSRWIPVEEQIPVDDTDVIVFKSGGIIDIAYWNGYAWRSFDSNYTLNVLAWMPLPDPFNPQN